MSSRRNSCANLYSLMARSHCSFVWKGCELSKREPLKDDRVSRGPILEESREEFRPLFSRVNQHKIQAMVLGATHELFGGDWNRDGGTLPSTSYTLPILHPPFWGQVRLVLSADDGCSRAGAAIRGRVMRQRRSPERGYSNAISRVRAAES